MKTTTLRAPLALALAVALSACGMSSADVTENTGVVIGKASDNAGYIRRIDDDERGVSCYVFQHDKLSCVRTAEVRP